MRLQLVRHATLVVRYPSTCLLVDPQLDDAGARAPLPGVNDAHARNPTRALPLLAADIAQAADAVLVTHLHADHFDSAARRLLDPHTPIICQPQNAEALQDWGFRDVRPVQQKVALGPIEVQRTPGRHGHGVIAQAMGSVSGFILRCAGEPTLYIAGDTVWCEAMRKTLQEAQPDVIVLNGGAAQLVEGQPVTMTADEVLQAARAAGRATIIVVHLEASNACTETRAQLQQRLAAHSEISQRLRIPADGDELELSWGHTAGAPEPTVDEVADRPPVSA